MIALVCVEPEESCQTRVMVLPGRKRLTMALSCSGVEIVFPFTLTMVSPWPRPALSAGDPLTAPTTLTPVVELCEPPWLLNGSVDELAAWT